MSGAGEHGGRGADTTAHTLSLRGPALGSHTLGSHVSPPLKAYDLEQGISFLRASVSSSEMGSWQDGVAWCRVLTGVVPRAWPELSSRSPGTMLTPFSLVSDFRTQDAPRPYVTKVNVRQVETSRPVGLRVPVGRKPVLLPGPASPWLLCSYPGQLSCKGLKRHRTRGEHSTKALSSNSAISAGR